VYIAKRRFERLSSVRAAAPVTLEFLRSDEYQELMNRYVPYDGDYGLHEAEINSKSFMFRAFQVPERLGAYRWRGVQENLDLILDLLTDDSKVVVDFGGAGSTFGLGSIIVDQLEYDASGKRVPYHSLDELPDKVDAVLSSHTLEHVPDLEGELQRIHDVLKPGGTFIAHLPSFSCVRWRVGVHSHPSFGDHVWTFGLSGTPGVPPGLVNYLEVDQVLARWFEVESAEYCGDDSIFAVCRRPADG
jgi:SAM-dependent methyltransferase